MPLAEVLESLPKAAGGRRANAHIHLPPNFSAFETVGDALDSARKEGIRLLGTSNYYDFDVYAEFALGAVSRGVYPLLGLEVVTWIDQMAKDGVKINDPGNPGKAYLCGKGIATYDNPTVAAAETLEVIRLRDEARVAQMAYALNDVFTDRGLPTVITPSFVCAELAGRYDVPIESVVLQERHLAQAYQEHLFRRVPEPRREETLERILQAKPKALDPVGVQGEIRTHLMKAGKPAYAEEAFVSFEQGIELVLELGGVPSYPVLADGTKPICPFEAEPHILASHLKRHGIHAAEFIPNRNQSDVLRTYVQGLRSAGFVVSAGTEHNTLDRPPIFPQCADGPVPDDVMAVFWEGACVLAAHQSRVARGEPGFVDFDGRRTAEIEAFAREGAMILG